jgi:hypothetical protein
MERETVKICSKCHTLKPLVKHRSICVECNLVRKREVAAAQQATPEGREANRARAAAFRATPEGNAYQREYEQDPNNKAKRAVAQRKPTNEKVRQDRFRQSPEYNAMMSDARAARKPGYWKGWGQTAEQKAARRVWFRKWQLSPQGRLSSLIAGAKKRAADNGLLFDLEVATFPELTACAVTGLPFCFDEPDETKFNPWAPSIDRKDPFRGYVKDNVQFVCVAYNLAKNQFSEAVLLRLARAIVDRNPQPVIQEPSCAISPS